MTIVSRHTFVRFGNITTSIDPRSLVGTNPALRGVVLGVSLVRLLVVSNSLPTRRDLWYTLCDYLLHRYTVRYLELLFVSLICVLHLQKLLPRPSQLNTPSET